MIEIISGNILDSEANFIAHTCDSNGSSSSNIDEVIPHVAREEIKLIRYCSKNGIELSGVNQYVPTEVWALVLVDTIKNNNITAFDKNYQYVVNSFCQNIDGTIDMKAMKKSFEDIRDKAQKIDASVSICYDANSCDWNDFYNVIKNVFDKSDVNVEIWRN